MMGKKLFFISILLSIVVLFSGCNLIEKVESVVSSVFSEGNSSITVTTGNEPNTSSGDMYVHFIDVGQGDSIFIEFANNETMLIDAGEKDQSDKIVTYIFEQGHDTLDYVIATHVHSDHIGGMAEVLNNFKIKNFYMTEAKATTKTYDNMMLAVKDSKANVHYVSTGDMIINEDNLVVEVIAPNKVGKDQNNNSIVVKLRYDDNDFLFTGDMENEEDVVGMKCDVLKVGHHGSETSTSEKFLDEVEPDYAVISCGLHNSYNHPSDKTLNMLESRGIKIFRTDIQGTIVFKSNGKDISTNVQPKH